MSCSNCPSTATPAPCRPCGASGYNFKYGTKCVACAGHGYKCPQCGAGRPN